MKTKSFHIGDVLSLTTGRLIALKHMDALYDLLEFMTGERPNTITIPRFSDECVPHLLAQFPELDSPQVQFAVAELCEMLKTPTGRKDTHKLMLGWFSKLTCGKYGIKVSETLQVKKLPRGVHKVRDELEEITEIVGPGKIIEVNIPAPYFGQN
jgi:hypothetical protein